MCSKSQCATDKPTVRLMEWTQADEGDGNGSGRWQEWSSGVGREITMSSQRKDLTVGEKEKEVCL